MSSIHDLQSVGPALFGVDGEPVGMVELVTVQHPIVLGYAYFHFLTNLVCALGECIVSLPVDDELEDYIGVVVGLEIEDLDVADQEGVIHDVGVVEAGVLFCSAKLVFDLSLFLDFLVVDSVALDLSLDCFGGLGDRLDVDWLGSGEIDDWWWRYGLGSMLLWLGGKRV